MPSVTNFKEEQKLKEERANYIKNFRKELDQNDVKMKEIEEKRLMDIKIAEAGGVKQFKDQEWEKQKQEKAEKAKKSK